jgi:TetR/AcrR family transcriptional regulator, ethionamide resistance regulator
MATETKPRAPRAASERSSRRRRREEARAQLLSSALELAEHGSFRDLTVDEIARSAGLSRSAFYTHFRDKHELLLAAVNDVAEQLYRMADRWWHGTGAPADRVEGALAGVISVYAEQASLLRLATEVSTYDDEIREVWLGIAGRFIDATAEQIRTEQLEGLIPQTLEARPTAETLVWMAERCCYIYLGRAERTPDEVLAALAPVWTAALYPGVIPAQELRPE